MTAVPDPVELDETAAAWLTALREADRQIAHYTGIRGRAIEHLQAVMGDAELATLNGQPAVTWAWSKPAMRLDRAKLEETFGPLDAYLVPAKAARPFKLTGAVQP